MMNFKIPFLAGLMMVVLLPAAQAQGPGATLSQSPACTPALEAIINLRPAFFGNPSVWDAVFGDHEKRVRFSGAVALENKNLLVAGEALDADEKPVEHVLVELNSRARAVDEKRYASGPGELSSGILKTASGFVVGSTVRGGARGTEKHTRLAWYDGERKFIRALVLKDAVFDYESMSIASAVGGRGFVAVVKAISRKDESDQHAVLFRLDERAKVLWKRAYRPGIPNHIYGVSIADGESYLAGGQIRNEDGRMAGWLMKIGDDGTIMWQNTYPRGRFAVFRSGYAKPVMDGPDHYVVAGQVVPYGSDPAAAWVLEVDSTGKTIWQRYLRAADFDIDGRGIQAYGDGRITVMANAKSKHPPDETDTARVPSTAHADHIRLLTLSPRGILIDDEAYLEGHTAEARQLINGWDGERIVTAVVTIKPPPPPAAEGTPPATAPAETEGELRNEGWVFVATGLDPYVDPCVIPASDPAP